MALPVWPPALPPLRGRAQGGGSPQLYAPPQRSAFDGGARWRRRALVVTTPLRMVLDLSFVTFPVFRTFVADELGAGTRRFLAPVVQPDGTVRANTVCRIDETGVQLAYPVGGQPQVSFVLLVYDWGAA